ncbi:restriction endonuclease subunit S [Corynebacterium meitnerae]|uniref:Restriction endonuclease subunit S n=1 Tax=Corynebacterium meitnerae TaxID=2913498 RepID=A0A9X3RKA4_9CORY|nr:restriction endonuclease subunit S [Corynebacterium meitnerae]MCZ9293647.1 restriction endonuclease subunit S [Corynebacterium meitnerae]
MTNSLFLVSDISNGQEWRNAGFTNTVPLSLLVNFRNEPNQDLDAQYLSLLREKGVMRYEDKGAVGNRKPEDLTRTKKVYAGDIIVNSMNFWIGSYGISPFDGVVSTVYHIISPDESKLNTRYLNYWFGVQEFRNQAQNMGNGILPHRRSISEDRFGAIRIPLPELETQRRIADYLDKEISEMDAVIEEFDGLVENLKNRKTQFPSSLIPGIQDAIDLSLGGSSRVCHSEVSLVPIRLLGRKNTVKNTGMLSENRLSLSYGNIVRKPIESSEGLRPDSYETYQVVQPGQTVLRFTDLQNDHKSLRSGLVREKGIVTSAYLSFVPKHPGLDSSFFAWCMRALDSKKVFYRMGSGVRQSLNWEEFTTLLIPLPSLDKQREIANKLDQETAKMDALIEESTRLIENLKARKTALITEVVTGRKEV